MRQTTTTTTTTPSASTTSSSSETTAAPTIIETIFSDINAIIPNFSSLVASYRLLVGSAEEIHRIPGVPEEMFRRAVLRFDNTGTLIDILLDLLCCKIAFSSEFLSVTCAPIDIVQLLSNCCHQDEATPCRTAEQIIQLEVLRRVLGSCLPSCFPPPPDPWPPCTPPCPSAAPPAASPASPPQTGRTAPPVQKQANKTGPCPPPNPSCCPPVKKKASPSRPRRKMSRRRSTSMRRISLLRKHPPSPPPKF